jgi:hypothetical protein
MVGPPGPWRAPEARERSPVQQLVQVAQQIIPGDQIQGGRPENDKKIKDMLGPQSLAQLSLCEVAKLLSSGNAGACCAAAEVLGSLASGSSLSSPARAGSDSWSPGPGKEELFIGVRDYLHPDPPIPTWGLPITGPRCKARRVRPLPKSKEASGMRVRALFCWRAREALTLPSPPRNARSPVPLYQPFVGGL